MCAWAHLCLCDVFASLCTRVSVLVCARETADQRPDLPQHCGAPYIINRRQKGTFCWTLWGRKDHTDFFCYCKPVSVSACLCDCAKHSVWRRIYYQLEGLWPACLVQCHYDGWHCYQNLAFSMEAVLSGCQGQWLLALWQKGNLVGLLKCTLYPIQHLSYQRSDSVRWKEEASNGQIGLWKASQMWTLRDHKCGINCGQHKLNETGIIPFVYLLRRNAALCGPVSVPVTWQLGYGLIGTNVEPAN